MRRRPEDGMANGSSSSSSSSSSASTSRPPYGGYGYSAGASYGGGAYYGAGAPQPPRQDNYYSRPEDRVRESSRTMFEQENDRRINDLSSQVSMLKELTIDIGTEVRSQNNLLEDMGSGFSRTDGLMGNTMRRLGKMLQTSSGRHMLWLVAFVVFVFVFVYYIVRHKGA